MKRNVFFLIFYDFINDLLTSQYYRVTPKAELRVQEFSNPSQLFNAPPHVTSAHEQNVFYSSTVGQISRERHEYTPVYRVCSNNVSQTYEQHASFFKITWRNSSCLCCLAVFSLLIPLIHHRTKNSTFIYISDIRLRLVELSTMIHFINLLFQVIRGSELQVSPQFKTFGQKKK